MSRGPGRVMRAALAELDERGHADPWTVVKRIAHGPGDPPMSWDGPTRSELVSARRALRALGDRGMVVLAHYWRGHGEPGAGLTAVKCCPECAAGLKATLTNPWGNCHVRDILDAADHAKRCHG